MQQTEEYITEEDFDSKLGKEPASFGAKITQKTNRFLESPYYMVALIILVAAISFLLGRISKMGESREGVRVMNNPPSPPARNAVQAGGPYIKEGTEKETPVSVTQSGQAAAVVNSATGEKVEVVGSKNGTKYHLPTCPGAKQISEKNLIKFESIEEARSRGYTPASNCKGIE